MSTTTRNRQQHETSTGRKRGNWWGVALGGVVCIGAVAFVTAQGLRDARTGSAAADKLPAADPDQTGEPATAGSAPVPRVDPADVATLAQMTGRDIPSDVQTMLEGSTPAHLEYDAKNNRHWWGPHNHWHDGPPPAGAAVTPAGATPVAAPAFDMNAPAVMPDGSAPGPWEYDAINNRHWHPEHSHWHQGPPPPPEDQ